MTNSIQKESGTQMNKRNNMLHGIDMTAPDAVERLMEFHRATFGDAVMEDDPDADAGTPPEGAAGGSDNPADADWDGDLTKLPTKVQNYIKSLNKDNASKRVEVKTEKAEKEANEKTLAAFKKALGIADEGAPVDPETLTAALSQKDKDIADRDAKITSLLVGAALSKALDAAKAKPTLLSFLRGEGKLDNLDPTAEGFDASLETLVKDTLTANPEFKSVPVADSSGADFSGARVTTSPQTSPGMGTLRAAFSGQ